jgi:2-polyprenyl-3-methyl-5-hydroxy-6-metoxy-1,4-benzoquinol methylase
MTTHLCPVCESPESVGRLDVEFDRLLGREDRRTYRVCRRCGTTFLTPFPTPAELATAYGEGYYAYQPFQIGRRTADILRASAQRTWYAPMLASLAFILTRNRDVPLLARRLRMREQVRVLDYGGGAGHAAMVFQAMGARVAVVDFSPLAVAQAREHGLEAYTVDEVPMNASFDLVRLYQVIEHVTDPVQLIQRLSGLLRDSSSEMILATPSASSWLLKRLGNSWWSLEVPRHITLLSNDAIQVIAERTKLRVVRIQHYTSASALIETLKFRWFERPGTPQRYGLGPAGRALALLTMPWALVQGLTAAGDGLQFSLARQPDGSPAPLP